MSGVGFGKVMAGLLALVAVGALVSGSAGARQRQGPEGPVEQGRYLVRIAGCNECHTAGFAEAGGALPEAQWLLGDRLGWQGAWGTTYAGNLRLAFEDLTMAQWLEKAGNGTFRPPMPWPSLRAMKKRDLKALYAFIRSLEPHGEATPAFVPPGGAVSGPVVLFPAPSKQ